MANLPKSLRNRMDTYIATLSSPPGIRALTSQVLHYIPPLYITHALRPRTRFIRSQRSPINLQYTFRPQKGTTRVQLLIGAIDR